MSQDDDRQTFQAHFQTLELDAPTLKLPPKKTIVPEASVPNTDTKSLPRLRTAPESPDASGDLKVVGTIGEGGMGLIQLANQVALDREVAIKTTRKADQGAVKGLLQEAYVTGHLEHPNIIPVYNLGRDDAGTPLLVMKRIEGVSWLDVMLDPRKAPGDERVDTAWHVRILMSVCDAVRFAHSRNIVHRDIKPENVMIGGFGEVYLLDWGIALATHEDDGPERFPHRSRVTGIAGTPAYMAPEMTKDDALEIDHRTDVYLLGACLHEILTGEVRHTGDSLFEIMYSAWNSEPYDYPPDVPSELADIANKAMSVKRSERYQSAEDFKQALQGYLEHRQSVQLVRDSMALLNSIEGILAKEEISDEDRARMHDQFIEARFGFRQALKSWPTNPDGIEGQTRCLTMLFRFLINRNEVAAARAVLAEFHEVPEAVEKELELAEKQKAKREREVAKLEEFREQYDFRFGAKTRSITALVLGALWTALTVYYWDMDAWKWTVDFSGYLSGIAINLGIPGLVIAVAAPKIFKNRGGQQLMGIVVVTLMAIFTVRTIGYIYQTPRIIGALAEWPIYSMAIVGLGAISERRIAMVSGTYLVATVVAMNLPEYYNLVLAFAHAFVFARMAWVWWPRTKKKTPDATL